MKYLATILMVLALTASYACNAQSPSHDNEREADTIEMPEIPSHLIQPTERADYLITHFWDRLDINNTDISHNRALMEQSFVNFLSILPYASADSIVVEGFSNLLKKTKPDSSVLKAIMENAEDYLSQADSPMQSEEQYNLYLTALINSDILSSSQQIRTADKIEMLSKNMKGSRATDFTFTTPEGSQSSLYKLLKPGKQLMVIFFDPDCESCEEVIKTIQTKDEITKDIQAGKLEILAVYSGENEKSWKRKAGTMPSTWTIGINKSEIEDNELYYLPMMPTIYLLDDKGIVIEKDIQI